MRDFMIDRDWSPRDDKMLSYQGSMIVDQILMSNPEASSFNIALDHNLFYADTLRWWPEEGR